MLANVVANWASNDQAAARAWFEKATLSEATRQNLQIYFTQPQR
jgi:hypothetical protein